MEYHQILPRLLVGSYPGSNGDIERLKRESGVTAVLSLQTDEDIGHFKLDWNSLLTHYESCGIRLHRVPVCDFDAVDLQNKLPTCVSALNEFMQSGHTVYLHCSAGVGRSPTVAIAYLFWCDGWALDTAVAHVQECRPCSPSVEAVRLAVKSR